MSSVVSDVYEGSAALGRLQSTIGLYIGITVAVILVICASYNFTQKESFLPVVAVIKQNSQCLPVTVDKTVMYDCVLNVEYVVANTKYNGVVTLRSDKRFLEKQNLEILYNPKNPNEIKYETLSPQSAAVFSLISASVTVCIVGFIYYITHTYKIAAAASGVGTIGSIAKEIF